MTTLHHGSGVRRRKTECRRAYHTLVLLVAAPILMMILVAAAPPLPRSTSFAAPEAVYIKRSRAQCRKTTIKNSLSQYRTLLSAPRGLELQMDEYIGTGILNNEAAATLKSLNPSTALLVMNLLIGKNHVIKDPSYWIIGAAWGIEYGHTKATTAERKRFADEAHFNSGGEKWLRFRTTYILNPIKAAKCAIIRSAKAVWKFLNFCADGFGNFVVLVCKTFANVFMMMMTPLVQTMGKPFVAIFGVLSIYFNKFMKVLSFVAKKGAKLLTVGDLGPQG